MPSIVPLKDASRDLSFREEAVSYQAALRFLYDRINYERMFSGTSRYPFRLNRMRQLLHRLGLQKYVFRTDQGATAPAIPTVHIAGTKGKGSTSSMVAAALSTGGIRTGLYTSPHLHHLEERFRIDGQPCQPNEIVTMVERLKAMMEMEISGEPPMGAASFFEMTTAMALMHFDMHQCGAIVLEVGLGGRLDSTNVCWPTITAITPIGLDHQQVLGNTLTSIATEKAGIIKPGIPVVCGISATNPTQAAVVDVITRRAKDLGAPLYLLDRDYSFEHTPQADWGGLVELHGSSAPLSKGSSLELTLEGRHQASNAAVAMAIVDLLRDKGVAVTATAAREGISKLKCEARIERFLLPHDVVAIVDAAHNENSLEALCQTIQHRRGNRQLHVVFGTSLDKSAAEMLARIGTVADSLVLTQYAGNPRFTPTETLRSLVPPSLSSATQIANDPIEACRLGLQSASPGGMLVICGSFFLAAETRMWIMEQESSTGE